jgi:hypothetical protein
MKIKIAIGIFIIIVLYGFYEKDRRATLYEDFRNNKPILCDEQIILKKYGWRIHHNRFFTNGKIAKTVVFCSSVSK